MRTVFKKFPLNSGGFKEAPTAKTWPKTHKRFFSPYHLTHLENGPAGEYLTDRLADEAGIASDESPLEAFVRELET